MKRIESVSIGLDKISNTPVVFLKVENSNYGVPIWIGPCEASALSLAIANQETPRPLTHDLIINMINTFGYRLEKIVINDMKNNIYYAQIFVETDSGTIIIDSRPSDAMVLAVKSGAPIYIEEKIVLENGIDMSFLVEVKPDEKSEEKKKKLKEFLDNFDIDELKKKLNDFDTKSENEEGNESE